MGAANRVAVNTGILYARMAITVFISLYATRLILAALGASDFGIFNVVGGAVAMLTFLNSAMAAATQRFMSYAQGENNESKQKQIFNVSVVLHLIIGIVLVFVLETAGYFLFKDVLKIDQDRLDVAKLIYHFLVFSTFVTVISVPYGAVINAHENMLFVAILGILEALLKLGIAFFVTYTGIDKLASYGFLMAALAVLLLLIQRVYCHRKYEEVEINIRKYYEKSLFKEMTGFAAWSFLGSAGSMIGNYGKGIVLNMFFGTALNAAAGVAVQLSAQLSVFSNVMLKALNPVIAKTEGSGKRDTMLKTSLLGIKMSFYLQAILFIPAFLEMDLLQNLWLNNPPEYSVIFCKLMLVVNLTDQLGITLPSAISAVGNIKQLQVFSSILNLMPLLLNYLFFSFGFPPETSLYIAFVFAIIKVAVYVHVSQKVCGLSIKKYLRDIVLRCLALAVVVSIIVAIPVVTLDEGLGRLVLTFFVSFVTSLLVIASWGFNKIEKREILAAIEGPRLKIKAIFHIN